MQGTTIVPPVPLTNSNDVVTIVSAAATALPAYPSGTTFLITNSANQVVTLPVLSSWVGCTYRFILNTAAAFTTQLKINGAATTIYGHAVVGPIAGATINVGAGTNTVRYSTSCVVGDVITLLNDGTNIWASCISGSNVAATAIIFA